MFSSKTWSKARTSNLTTTMKHYWGVLASIKRLAKEIKGIKLGIEKEKFSSFTDGTIVYIEKSYVIYKNYTNDK